MQVLARLSREEHEVKRSGDKTDPPLETRSDTDAQTHSVLIRTGRLRSDKEPHRQHTPSPPAVGGGGGCCLVSHGGGVCFAPSADE